MQLERKNAFLIKEVKQSEGIGEVSFYFLRFDKPDADGDTYDPELIISYDPNRVRWFLNHDPGAVLGRVVEVDRDDVGAYAVCRMPLVGRLVEVYELYRMGAISEHSFGFEVEDYTGNEFGGRHIKALRLWEVSTVTGWAAQAEANTILVKSNIFAKDMEMEEKIAKVISGVKLEAKLTEQESQAVQAALEGIAGLQTSLAQTQQAMLDGLMQVSNTLSALMQPQGSASSEALDTEAKSELARVFSEKKTAFWTGTVKLPSVGQIVKKSLAYYRPGTSVTQLPGAPAIAWDFLSGQTSYNSALFNLARIVSIRGTSFSYALMPSAPPTSTAGSGTGWCYTPSELNVDLNVDTQSLRRYATIMGVCNNAFDEYALLETSIEEMMRELVNRYIEVDFATLLLASAPFTPTSSGIASPNIWDLANVVAHDIQVGSGGKFVANVVIVHPLTALRMQSIKDATGQYLFGNRPDFGLQVVSTTLIPQNQMVVGDSSTLFWVEQDGRPTELSISYENRDFFERNIVTLRLTTVGLPFRNAAHVGAWRVVNDITAALGGI